MKNKISYYKLIPYKCTILQKGLFTFQSVGCRRCEYLGEDRNCVTEVQTSSSRMAEGNLTEEPEGNL